MRDLVKRELPEDRAAVRAQAPHHRRADRLRRPRRDDARPAAGRPDHRRGAPVDGEDEPRAEHRASTSPCSRTSRRLLQPGNVERVALHPPADVGSADRQPSADERRDRAEGLRPHLARARDAERDASCSSTTRRTIGVLEMRAKARRLQAEHGLNLLVVDYIQLMSGRGRFENRTLELASISRSLKGLAKELNVPIVVLSQLSPRARSALRPSAAAVRPARIGRPRAGRRRRHPDLPRGRCLQPGPEQSGRGHRRS